MKKTPKLIGLLLAVLAIVFSANYLQRVVVKYRSSADYANAPISGSFVISDFSATPSKSNVQKMVAEMKANGIDTVITPPAGGISCDFNSTPAKFSETYGYQPNSFKTYFLEAAKQNNMKIIMQLAYIGCDYYSGNPNDVNTPAGRSIDYSVRLIDELKKTLPLYGWSWSDPNFIGFYINQEADVANLSDTNGFYIKFYEAFTNKLKAKEPSKKIIISPWIREELSYTQTKQNFVNLMSHSKIDIIALQDSMGTGKVKTVTSNKNHFSALKDAVAQFSGRQAWANIESFYDDNDDGKYVPTSPSRLASQINSSKPYVSKTITWIYQHDFMASDAFDNVPSSTNQYTPQMSIERAKLGNWYRGTYLTKLPIPSYVFIYGQNLVLKGYNFGTSGSSVTVQATYISTSNTVKRATINSKIVTEGTYSVIYVPLSYLPQIDINKPYTATIVPSTTTVVQCINMYFCYTPDHTCRLTSDKYDTVSKDDCTNPANNKCEANLNLYISGKTTGVCYSNLTSCQSACK